MLNGHHQKMQTSLRLSIITIQSNERLSVLLAGGGDGGGGGAASYWFVCGENN